MRQQLSFVLVWLLSSTTTTGQDYMRRTWTDSTGKFSVEARLHGFDSDTALLKSTDGRELKIPVGKLSSDDQQFLKAAAVLKDSELQVDLMGTHTKRIIESPTAVLEILAELHRQFPDGIAAGLYASCINAAYWGSDGLDIAKDQLDSTIIRIRKLRKQLPDAHKQTFVSALNNRAVIALRERDTNRAVRSWKEACNTTDSIPFVVYHNATILLELSAQSNPLLKVDHRTRRDLISMLATSEPEGPGTLVPHRFMYSTLHDDFDFVQEATTTTVVPKTKQTELPPIEPGWQLVSYGSAFLIAPKLAITNRHVVDTQDARFRVRNEFGVNEIVSVGKISSDEQLDLAVLELPKEIGAQPLVLREAPVKAGEPFTVLGYPNPEQYEASLTVSPGSVNKQLDAGLSILHDAATNAGNSGGPCFDSSGNVTGVLTAVDNRAVMIGNQRGRAMSMPAALAFLGNVPGYKQLPASTGTMSIPKIVESVKTSVLQVECWVSEDHVRLAAAASVESASKSDPELALRKYALWPERTCFVFSGTGFRDCPKCIGGVISVTRRVQVSVNPNTGEPIMGARVFKSRCDLCRGRRGGKCSACASGRLPFDD